MLVLDKFGKDGLCGLLFCEVGVEMVEVCVIWVHEIDACGVVDLIAAFLGPVLVEDLVGFDLKLFHALLQLDIIP